MLQQRIFWYTGFVWYPWEFYAHLGFFSFSLPVILLLLWCSLLFIQFYSCMDFFPLNHDKLLRVNATATNFSEYISHQLIKHSSLPEFKHLHTQSSKHIPPTSPNTLSLSLTQTHTQSHKYTSTPTHSVTHTRIYMHTVLHVPPPPDTHTHTSFSSLSILSTPSPLTCKHTQTHMQNLTHSPPPPPHTCAWHVQTHAYTRLHSPTHL